MQIHDASKPETTKKNNFQSAKSTVQLEQRLPRQMTEKPLLESIPVSKKVAGEFFCQLFLQGDQIGKEFAVWESRMLKRLCQRRPHLKSSRCKQDINK